VIPISGTTKVQSELLKGNHHGEIPQNRQEIAPENRRKGQTLSLRHVPQAEPETCENTSSVVLPNLPETKKPGEDHFCLSH
jgi:hypothetical protein